MSWTYSLNPGTSILDEVRFLIQDTDEDIALLQDEELEYLIAKHNSDAGLTAMEALDTIIRKYALIPDRRMGQTQISYSTIVQNARMIRADMEESIGEYPGIYSRAHSVSAKEAAEENTDLVEPAFKRDPLWYRTDR